MPADGPRWPWSATVEHFCRRFLKNRDHPGLGVGLLCASAFPHLALEPAGFALIGMADLFAAILRAPVTGIVLVTEMTAQATLAVPMSMAVLGASLTSARLGNASILEQRRARLPAGSHPAGPAP